jgi:sortase A
VRRLLITLSIAATSLVTPVVAHAQSNGTRTFEEGVPRIAPSTAIAATIRIDKIKMVSPVYPGISMAVFAKGVGQWPGTPQPGQTGNIVLGGHRTSGKRPFANIDRLVPGDIISLSTKGKTFRYAVTSSLIVKPTAIWITDPTTTATLTLFACHPKGKTTQRYVVRASLIQ